MRSAAATTKRALGALFVATLSAAIGIAAMANAEIVKSGDVIVAFHGDISPRKLPRTGTAPVAVQMGAKIKGTDPTDPPVLDRIVLEINSHGLLQPKGLATCSLSKLNSVSSAQAKQACADALVGHGNVTSRVTLPGQGAFASNGPLLAFNGKYKGRTAIFAQVATGAPLPLTYVIVFEVTKTKGTFGTRLAATLPPIASEYGYISAFDMSLRRRYTANGQKLSYASAGCPAPEGFNAASFPLAKASYEFAGGRSLTQTLVRDCKVRGK